MHPSITRCVDLEQKTPKTRPNLGRCLQYVWVFHTCLVTSYIICITWTSSPFAYVWVERNIPGAEQPFLLVFNVLTCVGKLWGTSSIIPTSNDQFQCFLFTVFLLLEDHPVLLLQLMAEILHHEFQEIPSIQRDKRPTTQLFENQEWDELVTNIDTCVGKQKPIKERDQHLY